MLDKENDIKGKFRRNIMLKTYAKIGCLSVACLSVYVHAACNADLVSTKPSNIYSDRQDGVIVDAETGLMWTKCSLGQDMASSSCSGTATVKTWAAAFDEVVVFNDNNTLGYGDWRLPSAAELRTLVDKSCYSPAVNATIFPATQSSYWASSMNALAGNSAWYILFDDGTETTALKDTEKSVRFVRDNN
jgi:hypothetical protein